MVIQSKILQIQDFLTQLTDTDLGGVHDFSFTELENPTTYSPRKIVADYYNESDRDDSIYGEVSEYGLDMLEAINWEDVLYSICQEFRIDSRYEDFIHYLESIFDRVDSSWQVSPKKVVHAETYNEPYDLEGLSYSLSTRWQDLLFHADGRYFLLHFGVME